MKKFEKFLKENELTIAYTEYGMVSFVTKTKKEVTPRFAGEVGLKMWAMKHQERMLQTL